jgi:uncharacterized protein (DUF2267 family)
MAQHHGKPDIDTASQEELTRALGIGEDVGGERRDRNESPGSAAASVEAEIEQQRVLPPGVRGTDAAAAVLCVLAQRLSGGEARDLILALPAGLLPGVEACARHRGARVEAFDYDEFLRRVAAHLEVSQPEAEEIARTVFAAVQRTLPVKERRDVASQLPWDLEQLWRSTSA